MVAGVQLCKDAVWIFGQPLEPSATKQKRLQTAGNSPTVLAHMESTILLTIKSILSYEGIQDNLQNLVPANVGQ